ncbi:B-cell receptor CD22-like [Danio aesculapii]|uniref:B-cell receptor CD22-like n=1 Tax=Danio aesculapii TaxID=1142201 RepID=UPI0024C06EBF|nr:B-cell receptor CD22-like [Danio aesculapii]
MLMWLRMAPALHLIFLLIIHRVSSADWGVNYSPTQICALNNSTMTIRCKYTYPPRGYQIMEAYWSKDPTDWQNLPDLSKNSEYSQRLQYLGDKQQNCTVRLSHVTKNDEGQYYFRFISNVSSGRFTGPSGVRLSVTDLQLESPERVKEGDSVNLTCKSSCKLTDTPTFIWYRNSHTLTNIGDELNIRSVSRTEAGNYRCGVQGQTYISPAVYLNVTYAPDTPVISNRSAVIMEGDSVTLNCSSDSNPPAEISWFKGNKSLNSGRIFNISKISSDDSGEYKCGAKNVHGEKYSDPVTLDVQYPPRNVSVSVTDSGQLFSDLVSLMCISDSNPPALNFSWFKENQSSAVGSGQSFSAVQSGRFYCEAHNPHGAQRSDAVTVTVQQHAERNIITVTSVGLLFIFIVVVIIGLFIIKKQRSVKSEGLTVMQNDLYSDVSQKVQAHDNPVCNPGLADESPYETMNPRISAECRDAEEIQYATVQYHKNTPMKREEEEERQSDSIPVQQPDQDHRQETVETVEESVIYSMLK